MTLARIAQPSQSSVSTAIAHSHQLINFIKAEIAANGPVSFARYMELALYAPGLGYYSAGTHKLGEAGDFVTAPEISSLFSRCIARQCQQILSALGYGDILEFGAGSGVMAADLLLELEALDCLPQHYYILEISADLKQRQQQLLQNKIPQLYDRIVWLDTLPTFALKGVILANEVIDAMPVHKFKIEQEIKEYFVTYQNDKLTWQIEQASPNLAASVLKLGVEFAEGYESEINLNLPGWLTSLSNLLNQGLILLVDYGFPRHEYYHPERSMGTLMCHYQHRAHSDPLLLPGLQDITAHVDFTAIAEVADNVQLDIAGYTPQANFLLSCGITNLLSTDVDNFTQMKLKQQIKKLTLPQEMGELFKVIALTRHWEQPLLGFNLHDMREKL